MSILAFLRYHSRRSEKGRPAGAEAELEERQQATSGGPPADGRDSK